MLSSTGTIGGLMREASAPVTVTRAYHSAGDTHLTAVNSNGTVSFVPVHPDYNIPLPILLLRECLKCCFSESNPQRQEQAAAAQSQEMAPLQQANAARSSDEIAADILANGEGFSALRSNNPSQPASAAASALPTQGQSAQETADAPSADTAAVRLDIR